MVLHTLLALLKSAWTPHFCPFSCFGAALFSFLLSSFGYVPFLEGEYLDMNSIVGRLAPRDSATFYLTVRHNGFFVRWADLYSQTHPLDSAEIAKFLQKVEL